MVIMEILCRNPYKSGKYSYRRKKRDPLYQDPKRVAIPYKSGKYSYMKKGEKIENMIVYVAIPYKSGKYSYINKKGNWDVKDIVCRNPL